MRRRRAAAAASPSERKFGKSAAAPHSFLLPLPLWSLPRTGPCRTTYAGLASSPCSRLNWAEKRDGLTDGEENKLFQTELYTIHDDCCMSYYTPYTTVAQFRFCTPRICLSYREYDPCFVKACRRTRGRTEEEKFSSPLPPPPPPSSSSSSSALLLGRFVPFPHSPFVRSRVTLWRSSDARGGP